jgi:FkbM family methyltransferase
MKRLFRKILGRLDATYKNTALKSNGTIFCLLFNARAILLRKDVRCTYDNLQRIYKAESSRHFRYFFAKEQNWNCYQGGLSKRAQQLGRAYFCHLIDFKENDLVVDCGANVGDLELYFQENNLLIKYVGIEPSPREYICLQKNVKESQTHNIGLWSEENNLSFFVSSDNADSSFIEPVRYTKVVSVATKRLDTLISEPVKLLKIEAEGAEPEALLGCSQLLSKIEYISADLGFERGLLQESTLAPVTNYLLQNGFELLTVGYPRIVALFKRRSISFTN